MIIKGKANGKLFVRKSIWMEKKEGGGGEVKRRERGEDGSGESRRKGIEIRK